MGIMLLLLCGLFADALAGHTSMQKRPRPDQDMSQSHCKVIHYLNATPPQAEREETEAEAEAAATLPPPRVAVYLQYGQNKNIDIITSCISSIAAARSVMVFTLDLYVSFIDSFNNSSNDISERGAVRGSRSDGGEAGRLVTQFRGLLGVDSVYVQDHINAGFDVGPFIKQLNYTMAMGKEYDIAMKIHTKSNEGWLKHCVDCLCGTRQQVVSILLNFMCIPTPTASALSQSHSPPNMIAAQGTVFGSLTDRASVAPFLIQQLFNTQELWLAFEDHILADMAILYNRIFGGDDNNQPISHFAREDAIIVAGTMFWVRVSELCVEKLVSSLPWLQHNLTTAYMRDGRVEHILERLFPSMIEMRKRRQPGRGEVMTMGPAVRILLMIYPEMIKDFRKYINHDWVSDIAGVVQMYHWSYRSRYSSATINLGPRPPLRLTPFASAMSLPFVLAWVPGNGMTYTDRKSPSIENEQNWRMHFEYVKPLLMHTNCIHIGGEPMFIITYTTATTSSEQHLVAMMKLWIELAKNNGLKGIYFVALLEDDRGGAVGVDESLTAVPRTKFNSSVFFQAAIELFPSSRPIVMRNDSVEHLSVSESGTVVKVGDIVTVLTTKLKGQRAKIIKCVARKDGKKSLKVKLLNYVNGPVYSLDYSDITAVPRAEWPVRYPLSRASALLQRDNIQMMYWGLQLDEQESSVASRTFDSNVRELISCIGKELTGSYNENYLFLNPRFRRTQDVDHEAIRTYNNVGDEFKHAYKGEKRWYYIMNHLKALEHVLHTVSSNTHA